MYNLYYSLIHSVKITFWETCFIIKGTMNILIFSITHYFMYCIRNIVSIRFALVKQINVYDLIAILYIVC